MRLFVGICALLFLPFCWNKPRYGMILLVALQVVFLGGSLEVSSEKYVYGAFFGILLLAWLPGLFRTRKAWIKHPVAKWLLAVFGIILISRFAGAAHAIPAVDWFRDLSPMLNYFWILLAVSAFGPRVDIRRYALFFLIFIAIVTVPITLQWMYYRAFVADALVLLDNTTLGPSVTLFGTFLAAAFALDAKDKRERRKYIIFGLGFAAAAFLTGTRIVVATIAAGSFAYLLLLRHEHKVSFKSTILAGARPAAALVLLLAVLVATKSFDVSAMLDRYAETTTSDMLEDDTVKDRVLESIDGWNAFMESPLLGQGLGYRIETTYTTGGIEWQPRGFFMHNFYIYLLTKFGATGLVFLGFLISILRHAVKGYFRRADSFEKYYFGSMAALMVALMLLSITAAAFNDRLPTAMLGIMVGMMVAMDYRGNQPALSER